MRYPSAEELRAMPRRRDFARLEDRMMNQLLAAKAADADAGAPEALAAMVTLLLSLAAREGLSASAAAGELFDEEAFVEAARAAAHWAAHRQAAFTDACECSEAPCETH